MFSACLVGCYKKDTTPIRTIITDTSDAAHLRKVYTSSRDTWPLPIVAEGTEFVELAPVSPPPNHDNLEPLSQLGEKLFFDPMLSKSGDISCASCHNPGAAFAENRRHSKGHDGQVGNRNAPALLSIAATPPYFHDGRAASLEEQALGPLQNPIEMATNMEEVEKKINASRYYRNDFKAALEIDAISMEDIAIAIASYERTLYKQTKLDRFLEGNGDEFTDQEILGLHLYRTKAQCMSCHGGPHLTDGKAHNIGLTYYGRKFEDLGIYNITKDPKDVGVFDTPSLRHISKTGPYMHNGIFPSLRGIVNLYNAGMPRPKPKPHQIHDPLFPETSDLLVKLELTKEEKLALVAFLNAL